MRFAFIFVFLFLCAYCANAQNDDTEEHNYKHLHNARNEEPIINNSALSENNATLHNQRTHKKSSRSYIIIPTDGIPETNVQGRKLKRNYKNQFN